MTAALRDLGPWLGGLALAGAAHASVALAVIGHSPQAPLAAPQGAFVVELAEIATSRGAEARDLALGTEARAQEAIAASEPAAEAPPPQTPDPLPQDAPLPAPEPDTKPAPAADTQPEVAQDSTTHSDAALLAAEDRARAQAVARRPADPQQVAAWMHALEIALQKEKTYPEAARRARAEGVATLRIVLGADGALIDVTLVQGSGVTALDEAALALVARAAPFPPPPMTGANGQLSLLVPVNYALH